MQNSAKSVSKNSMPLKCKNSAELWINITVAISLRPQNFSSLFLDLTKSLDIIIFFQLICLVNLEFVVNYLDLIKVNIILVERGPNQFMLDSTFYLLDKLQ